MNFSYRAKETNVGGPGDETITLLPLRLLGLALFVPLSLLAPLSIKRRILGEKGERATGHVIYNRHFPLLLPPPLRTFLGREEERGAYDLKDTLPTAALADVAGGTQHTILSRLPF